MNNFFNKKSSHTIEDNNYLMNEYKRLVNNDEIYRRDISACHGEISRLNNLINQKNQYIKDLEFQAKFLTAKHHELISLREKYKKDIDDARINQKRSDMNLLTQYKKENSELKKEVHLYNLFIKSIKEWISGSSEDINSAITRLRNERKNVKN